MDPEPKQLPTKNKPATGGAKAVQAGSVVNHGGFPLVADNRTTKRRALERIAGNMVVGVTVVNNGVRCTLNDRVGEFHR